MYKIDAAKQLFAAFVSEEEGAQVVEYGLIIAVVSITLVVALSALGTGTPFGDFITRVGECLQGEGDCAATPATPPDAG